MTQLAHTFSALGNQTRFAIVERLLNEGDLPVGAFLTMDNLSPPALSRHFKVLREAGIIERRVDKQQRIYSVRPQAVQQICEWSISYRKFWSAGLDRLEQALSEAD
ncbi:MAG: helix-turn-helix transcriptional regulator [Rhizobiales bacterium]|nr:metalloregulator ArsR/SmtB family transcription factor [Hyphomicrobiales bacterium]NRB13971.1 helix-turn-helix transcriptional regulator [Hyphomicrobiales bacterium]